MRAPHGRRCTSCPCTGTHRVWTSKSRRASPAAQSICQAAHGWQCNEARVMLTGLVRRLWRGKQRATRAVAAAHPAELTQQAIASLDGGDAERAIALLQQALRLGGESVEA